MISYSSINHKSIVATIFTVAIAFFISCGGGGGGGSTPTDYIPDIKAVGSSGNTSVIVYFSEPVDESTAQDTANYVLTPSIAVTSATRDAVDTSMVTLVTAAQTSGTNYKLEISNIEDLTGNTITANSFQYFIGTGAIDSTQPSILSVTTIDDNTIEVIFSEPMNTTTTTDSLNYTVTEADGSILTITGVVNQAGDMTVRLTVTETLNGYIYTIFADYNDGGGLLPHSDAGSIEDTNANDLSATGSIATFTGSGTMPSSITDGPVISDPTGDGTTNGFSMLFTYNSKVYIGPSGTDSKVFRINPDGTEPELVSLVFDNTHEGSLTYSLDPGPDTEDGIDFFTSGAIGGTEYLFIGPSRSSGNLIYMYYTSDSGNTLTFNSIDYNLLGGQSKGVSSMFVYNDNMYAGVPDTGGARPYFIKLNSIEASPTVGTEIINLDGTDMPRIGNGGTNVGIDTIYEFDGSIFIANGGQASSDSDGGIVRSIGVNKSDPGDYSDNSGDWEDITPTGITEWYNSNARYNIILPAINKLLPGQKAFPAMASFNGKLYVARNTNQGPQLWVFEDLNGTYEESDWALFNDGDDITDLGDANNTHITLLVANGGRLYIGFDNATTGVEIWRTKTDNSHPSALSDFEQVGADGLGDATNNHRINHGFSVADGSVPYLWLICGKSGSPLTVFRTNNN